ncbi:UDP-glucose/GDP-mannose dehydrogenase family protein [Patescibacteria group bacterium]|nr:UDP-glucose/GDP-mannose dehydrogenase family protein [Patescibacteria group bacterium]
MKITVVGTGYVGLVTGTCFAEMGFDVMGVDIDRQKIDNLKNGIMPIYEPGLEEMVRHNQREGRLHFSSDIRKGVEFADVLFSAVGTPPDKDHKADLQYVRQVAKSFGENVSGHKIFVNKSTVPVGTGSECKKIIQAEIDKRGSDATFDIVSNPEFLREGAAIKDTMNPERIVVGVENDRARTVMEKIYRPLTRTGRPLLFTDIKSAEVIKYAANSFLAVKISFINEMANFCERSGADIRTVAKGIGMDSRIGSRFLHAGIGYGGSCFPKDVQALIQKGKEYNYDFRILEAAEQVNERQKELIFEKLHRHFPDMEGKTIAVWGLAFKPRTDDMRDAPSIKVIKRIQAEGGIVRTFDPVAMENARRNFASVNLNYCKSAFDAASGADVILVLTEWDEFRTVDLKELKSLMKGNLLLDGRNIYDPKDAHEAGFIYEGIGIGLPVSAGPSGNAIKISGPKIKEKKPIPICK